VLNRIDGIGSVSLVGVPKRAIYVDIEQNKMDAYHLTIEQIGNVIAMENLNMPSGSVKMATEDYQLRVESEFAESKEIKELIVGNYNGKSVYLKDVATVRDTIKDISFDQRLNAKQGMTMMVTKQSGANTVKIAKLVKQELAKLVPTLPPDITISEIYDSSTFIQDSINNLTETLMFALIFVVLVVLFFLGRWRATLIISLSIPLSLICAFIYLQFTGNSVNIISLSSLSIAIGMVVDDAIVVLENISRHVDRGSSPREAAIYATNEVWLSVIVTTLVIVAVFLPLTMVTGITGIMFKQLGWIVTITVVASAIAAITVIPMLSSRMLKIKDPNRKISRFGYENTIEKWLKALDTWYTKILGWCLTHKKIVSLSVVIIFAASMWLVKFIGTDFMPESDESRFSIMIELQTGTRVEETMKTARSVEKYLHEAFPDEIILISSGTGASDGGVAALFSTNGTNISNLTVRLVKTQEREKSVFDIAVEVREELKNYPEIVNFNVSTSSSMGMMGGNEVNIEIFGYDFDRTNKLASEIKEKISTVKGAENIQISRKDDRPELKIKLNKEKLAQHGLSSAVVSTYVRNRVDGMIPSKLREEGQEYDIIVRLEEESRNSISKLEEMTIMTPQGKQIKLSELGEVDEYWSPPNIDHKRKERIVTVSVTPVGVPLGDLVAEMQTQLNSIEVPNDLMVHIGGAYEDQQESFMSIALLLALSLILVYIVMASQFESFSNPFVIMFSIPFAFSGSILALYITGTTINMIAALGMVLLVGIVVKNGIVLVDFINLTRDRGVSLYEAIKIAGHSRLRPVLMTSLTTILGMLPMALSTGEGSETWAPMGITVIGGLTFSTLITLIIIPVMYAIVSKSGERDKVEKVRKRFRFMDEA